MISVTVRQLFWLTHCLPDDIFTTNVDEVSSYTLLTAFIHQLWDVGVSVLKNKNKLLWFHDPIYTFILWHWWRQFFPCFHCRWLRAEQNHKQQQPEGSYETTTARG